MATNNNLKCLICGSEYDYCPNCGDNGNQSWRVSFCSENCNKLYDVITGFRDERYSKNEAYEKLQECDISKLYNEEFNAGGRKIINNILPKSKVIPVKEKESTEEESKIVDDNIEKQTEQNVSDIVENKVEKKKEYGNNYTKNFHKKYNK